jgi:hypothetical protein
MKERNDRAKTVACAIAVQLFALAVYFCLNALMSSGMFLSLSEEAGKVLIISLAAAIAIGICVLNFMTVIRGKKVYITRPDSIALRDGEEVVDIAYATARPVLIYKITCSLVVMAAAGLVYIRLLDFMEDQGAAGLYGKIICCIASAIAVLTAYPCIDRISCYRALLGQTHELSIDTAPTRALSYIMAFAVPASVFAWYVMRYFGSKRDIAWIVFPVCLLFALAFAFLAEWKKAGYPKTSA